MTDKPSPRLKWQQFDDDQVRAVVARLYGQPPSKLAHWSRERCVTFLGAEEPA